MTPAFYAITCDELLRRINAQYIGSLPVQNGTTIDHCLWMIAEITTWERTLENALKAARWVGWILRSLELYTLLSNGESRELVRLDVTVGNDMPVAASDADATGVPCK